MKSNIRLFSLLVIILSFVPVYSIAQSDDADELTGMLHRFLSTSDQRQAHVDFWADDLVYTSSNGTRRGKAEILAGFEESEQEDDGPVMTYTGEDVKIQLFGATAIITFQLVGTPADGSAVQNYFNTGTFLKRDGKWQAVAWQATVIPEA